jgi:DNA-directed RNA polymerase specialized sigma24 family protein
VRHPKLTEPAFRRLLVWLDDGVDSQGETYLEMRRRLVAYFDRRNSVSPDALADETFKRVANTLEQSTIAVTPPARYCYVVARFVFLEDVRRRESAHDNAAARADRLVTTSKDDETGGFAIREQRLECLDRCLNALDPVQRVLIVGYYSGVGREKIDARRELAARLGITMNALSSRASRIRDLLERCVAQCDCVSSPVRNEDA